MLLDKLTCLIILRIIKYILMFADDLTMMCVEYRGKK